MNDLKERKIGELIDVITMSANHGRFAFFLGAGCSVDAGIPTAYEITTKALIKLYERTLRDQPDRVPAISYTPEELREWGRKENCISVENEYSSALESLFYVNINRQQWLEQFFKNVQPTKQHMALSKIAKKGIIKHFFTTNFDRLLEDSALQEFIVVTHENHKLDTYTDKSVIYKLHGDFFYQSIKNTSNECKELPPYLCDLFVNKVKNHGIVVIGYGGNDESIMHTFRLLSADDVPLIFWWVLKDDNAIPQPVKELSDHFYPNMVFIRCAGFSDLIDRLSSLILPHMVTNDDLPSPSSGLWVAKENGLKKLVDNLNNWIENTEQSVALISGESGVGKTRLVKHIIDTIKDRPVVSIEREDSGGDRTKAEVEDKLSKELGDANWRNKKQLSVLIFIDDFNANSESNLWDYFLSLGKYTKILLTVRNDRKPTQFSPFEIAEFEHQGLSNVEMEDLISKINIPCLSNLSKESTEKRIKKLIELSGRNPQKLKEAILILNKLPEDSDDIGFTQFISQSWKPEEINVALVLSILPKHTSASAIAYVTGADQNLLATHLRDYSKEDPSLYECVNKYSNKEKWYIFNHDSYKEFFYEYPVDSNIKRNIIKRIEDYIIEILKLYGGRPRPDLSNYQRIDDEIPNIRWLYKNTFDQKRWGELTQIFHYIFAYLVDRGSWYEVKSICEHGRKAPDLHKPAWLVWSSWIALYMDRDAIIAQKYSKNAQDILKQRGISESGDKRQLFEAHRRHAIASIELCQFDAAEESIKYTKDAIKLLTEDKKDADEIDIILLEAKFHLEYYRKTKDKMKYNKAKQKIQMIINQYSHSIPTEYCLAELYLGDLQSVSGEVDTAISTIACAIKRSDELKWWRGNEIGYELMIRIHKFNDDKEKTKYYKLKLDSIQNKLRPEKFISN